MLPITRLEWLCFFALAIVQLALVSPAAAQTAGTGAIIGTVSDQTGAVVPAATIKVVSGATGESRQMQSYADGAFAVPLLPPGFYRVEVSKPGFKTFAASNIRVAVTETTKLPVVLSVGTAETMVQVEANAPVAQTESTTLGRVVDENVVRSLPLLARNYTQIIGLSPGVVGNLANAGELGRGSTSTGGSGAGYSVHGDRTYDNNFQINGLGVNDFFQQGATSGGVPVPNPDAIQEFKVQTAQYDAAFGRNAGANVNIVTRSGTKQFHGTVFEFFRNTALNANNWFSNHNRQPKPVLNQNQFGFTLGGPVVKSRLFFFGSYQGTRQVNGVASLRTVLSVPLTDDRTPQGIANVLYGPGTTAADRRGVQQTALGGVGPVVAPDGSNIHPVALRLLQLKLPDGTFLIKTPANR